MVEDQKFLKRFIFYYNAVVIAFVLIMCFGIFSFVSITAELFLLRGFGALFLTFYHATQI